MHDQSPNPHRLFAMQFKHSIWKGATSFLVQSLAVGDDTEDTMAPPCATMLDEFVESGKWPIQFLLS